MKSPLLDFMENDSPRLGSSALSVDFVRVVAPRGSMIRSFLRDAVPLALERDVRVEAVFNYNIYKIDPSKVIDSVVQVNAVTERS